MFSYCQLGNQPITHSITQPNASHVRQFLCLLTTGPTARHNPPSVNQILNEHLHNTVIEADIAILCTHSYGYGGLLTVLS